MGVNIMTLIVEFFEDFDPSILDGFAYTYTNRTLYLTGPEDTVIGAIDIIDSVTMRRSIVLKGGQHGQEEGKEKKTAHATT
jgi:hypothetical protein